MNSILLLVLLLGFPALVLWLEPRLRPVRWLGNIVVCYIFGLLLGNLPGVNLPVELRSTVSEISVSLAIPCLLFSANLLMAVRQAKKSLFSFLLCSLAVSISASLAWWLFRDKVLEADILAGMLAGVYTGGTPNLSAVATALDAPVELFGLVNTIDMALSGAYLLFLLSVAKPLLKKWLPATSSAEANLPDDKTFSLSEHPSLSSALLTLLFGILILALAAGSSLLMVGSLAAPLVILGLSSFGILASLIPFIHQLKGSYAVANYLLLVFSFTIGSLADVSLLVEASNEVLAFCCVTMLGAVLIHYLFARLFGLDAETVLVTSTAAIFGPAFVGPVVQRLPAQQLLIPGIAVGMLGYAIGNYLGISLAYILSAL